MTITVLLVDDSPTFRLLCRAQLEAEGFSIAGVAGSGAEGVALTERLRPDVVLMDVHMPELDGYEATRRIMDAAPTPVVVVSAPGSEPGVRLSLEALEAGALAAMPKPPGPDADEEWERLARTLRTMAAVRVVRRRRGRFSHAPAEPGVARPGGRAEAVAIAASTGGPAALRSVLGELPASFPAPILLVQHIGPEFVDGFVRWLDALLPLDVRLAAEGDPLEPGRIYVAPDAAHLRVRRSRISLDRGPPIGGFRPSANALFGSVADAFAERALAVILTGMGRDGLEGLVRVNDRGGWIVAQDEETSVVYSMPGSAVRAGIASRVLPLPQISAHILECVQ